MYSNQSPQTAYQQFYNNMPSYPQGNQQPPDKQPMVEKYPLQIWVAARAGISLTCAADLNVPEEGDTKYSPMEMHTGYSVFRMAIASSEKGSVVANIPAHEPVSVPAKHIKPAGNEQAKYPGLYRPDQRKELQEPDCRGGSADGKRAEHPYEREKAFCSQFR